MVNWLKCGAKKRKLSMRRLSRACFSSNFQITGLEVVEARDLSLLLRAGRAGGTHF